ncbi:MAG: alpha/beta hydrolase family protein [Gemmataceae bacterium]|nr:alpha/beta hydrolase family protein [Gemmataceae bacterium]
MIRRIIVLLVSVSLVLLGESSLPAQVRVTPKASKGGHKQGQAWAEVPDSFKSLKIPDWPMPTDLERWNNADRARTRATLLQCLGDMPPRPDPRKVKVISKEEHDDYTLERFEFHNGVDMIVPGILLIPRDRKGAVPAIIGLHGHGSSMASICTDLKNGQCVGPILARRGYVVAAIDAAFNGERVGKGPAGPKLDKGAYPQEMSLFKLYLLQGRCLWGMMLREEQCLIDYLETRPEVDKTRIGATGMSMGCTRAWWLAAIDDRIKAVVGVACFTRYTELIAHGNLRKHGIYYFVPGVFKHFNMEALHALIAPRPHLELSGDQDGGAPTDGIITFEEKLIPLYQLHGKPGNFRSVIYENTGHEYLPEMRAEMAAWFEKHLPVKK